MPVDLPLTRRLKVQGWKVKIQEKERVEPPHVTNWHRRRKWRLGLRNALFLDGQSDPRDVPDELIKLIHANWRWLCEQRDRKYPQNPVGGDR